MYRIFLGSLGPGPEFRGSGRGLDFLSFGNFQAVYHDERRPIFRSITIIGGLIASQLLTLYTTPVVYLLLDRLRIRLVAQTISRWPQKSSP
jgi:hypothetical protein